MKRILLVAGSAIAMQGAFGADAATPAKDTPVVATAADTDKARRELVELRAEMQELSRKMAALSSELGEGGPRSYAYRYVGDPDSAMIGVVLGMSDGRVVVGAMTPDGPAMRAGLRGSDVITAIDHKPVEGKNAVEAVEKARDMLRDLKTGQKVTIDYLRDGKKSSVTFAAERREALNWPLVISDDPEHPMMQKDFDARVRAETERAMREAQRVSAIDRKRIAVETERATREAMQHMPRHLAMPWWGLNLAPLNADLGRYFGADKGVLVIAADPDSLPGIRAGDVITSIAGEPVERPEDALRALRDQESGKEVPIRILREKKTLSLAMKAPAYKSIFDLRGLPAPPAPPAPAAPAAPGVPAAPAAIAAPAGVPAPSAVPVPPKPPALDDAR
ncbi:MAG TPA: PDZ domain-containing protein [Rhodanobacteraceae bacterium]|nr:PDZ domain-containing protein [Rhodanobacteraceae bacterium]